MNVGDLRALLEFVDDNVRVYVPSVFADGWKPAQGQFEFLVESSQGEKWREIAHPDDSIDNEVGLVIW